MSNMKERNEVERINIDASTTMLQLLNSNCMIEIELIKTNIKCMNCNYTIKLVKKASKQKG